jgi:tetratricopeptide (TPR) repeat protein
MDDGAIGISTAQNLIVYRSDSSHLVNVDDLLCQGLALADELDSLMESADRSSVSTFSPLNSQMDAPFSLFREDNTVLQEESELSSDQIAASQSAKANDGESGSDWAKVWLQRGLGKLKQGNFQGARDNFERALEKSPGSVSALNGLGIAQYRLANFTEAVQAFRQAVDLDPSAAGLYCNLGAALYLLGDFLNAIALFQKAARLAPREVHAYYGLGVSLMQQRQYSKAIAAFRRAVALDNQHAASYYGMGYVRYLMGELPAAIAALGKAKQRDPQYARRYETFLKHCLEQDGLSAGG